MPPTAPPPHTTDPPAHPADLHCPLCAYDLRGLPDPRCPECGHRFEWADLTDPARRQLRWLVEHRFRPDSILATSVRTLRPWRFWKTLRPSHRLHVGRAVRHWLVGPIASLLVVLLLWVGWALLFAANAMASGQPPGIVPGLTKGSPTDIYFRVVGDSVLESLQRSEERLVWGVCVVSVPVSTAVVLAVMWQSFARARILRSHAVRVWAYATDLLPLAAVGLMIGAIVIVADRSRGLTVLSGWSDGGGFNDRAWFGLMLYSILAYVVVSAVRLEAAVRLYLGVRRAWSVALIMLVLQVVLWITVVITVVFPPF